MRSSAGSSGYLTAESRFRRSEQARTLALLFAKDALAGEANGSGFVGSTEADAVVLGAEVARPMAAEPAAAVGDRRAQDHELGRSSFSEPRP